MRVFRPYQNIVSIKGRFLIWVLVLLAALALVFPALASAVEYPKLSNRSLTLDDVSPGALTNYIISYAYPSPTTIGSIRLLICTTAIIDEPCVNPGGDLSLANLDSQTGITGFSIFSQSSDEILLSRAPAAAGTVQSTYEFGDVSNPAGLAARFFIRIQTYPTADGTGVFNHASSVVSAITEPIVINTEVPPILYFCAGLTITQWCNNVTGNFIDYGTLSSVGPNYSTSQFGVATNAAGGYVVTVNGDTMTSGNKVIDALTVPTASSPGIPQFGINLRANTNPATGQDAVGAGVGVVGTDYDIPDSYKYADGDIVASAITGSFFNTFTVTYVVNVPSDQAAGVYNTTIGYICTAAF